MLTLHNIDTIIEESLSTVDLSGEPEELYAPVNYYFSMGGKRLRPKMALVAYTLFSEEINRSILYPAIGIEIFHGFTLIHDDIMDNAPIRRGMATLHKRWNNNTAILSGDVMCIKSYQYIAECPPEYIDRIMPIFSRTAAKVCEGQQYDMNFERYPFITMEEYINMIGLKTAVLIAASAQIGAIIAGAPDSVAEALYNYAYQLGLAFQIKDDYLDSFGECALFGKQIGGDILCNKKTWLQTESFRVADAETNRELTALMMSENLPPEEKIGKVLDIYRRLGVQSAAKEAMALRHRAAIEALDAVQLTQSQRKQLTDFALSLINREK